MAKNSLYNVVYTLANTFFSLLSSVYMSRILQPEGIGNYSYILTFVSYFVSLAALGIPVHGIREIAKVRDKNEEKNRVFSELFIMNFFTSCFSFCFYLLVLYFTGISKQSLDLYIRLGMLIAANILNIDWLYKGEEEYGYIALRSIIIKLCSLILLVLCIHSEADINRYADITVLAACGNYIYNVIHAQKLVKFTRRGFRFARHIKPNLLLAISSFFGDLYNKIDITMLGVLATDYSVGIYSNAHKIVNIIISCSIAATGTFLPRISSVLKDSKQDAIHIVNKGLEMLVFICIPLTFGLCVLSKQVVLFLYGDSFADAAITINILSCLIIIRGIGDLVCYQLQIAAGLEKMRVPASFLTAILNITMNWLLIPALNENGAAIASVASELFVNAFLYVRMKKVLPFRGNWSDALKTVIASVIMVIAIYGIMELSLPLLLTICCSVLVGVIVYVSVSWIIKNKTMMELIEHLKKKPNSKILH